MLTPPRVSTARRCERAAATNPVARPLPHEGMSGAAGGVARLLSIDGAGGAERRTVATRRARSVLAALRNRCIGVALAAHAAAAHRVARVRQEGTGVAAGRRVAAVDRTAARAVAPKAGAAEVPAEVLARGRVDLIVGEGAAEAIVAVAHRGVRCAIGAGASSLAHPARGGGGRVIDADRPDLAGHLSEQHRLTIHPKSAIGEVRVALLTLDHRVEADSIIEHVVDGNAVEIEVERGEHPRVQRRRAERIRAAGVADRRLVDRGPGAGGEQAIGGNAAPERRGRVARRDEVGATVRVAGADPQRARDCGIIEERLVAGIDRTPLKLGRGEVPDRRAEVDAAPYRIAHPVTGPFTAARGVGGTARSQRREER